MARHSADAAIRKLIKQELCRTTDSETYRQNNQYDVNSRYYTVEGFTGIPANAVFAGRLATSVNLNLFYA